MPTPANLLLGAEVLAAYARVRWLLHRKGLEGTVATLRAGAGRRRQQLDPDGAWHCARAVLRVLGRLPADSRCLMRSLVLLSLLARRGTDAELVIGVLPAPRFTAHAWVEYRGVPLLKPGEALEGRLLEL
jgi:hypothetical protein